MSVSVTILGSLIVFFGFMPFLMTMAGLKKKKTESYGYSEALFLVPILCSWVPIVLAVNALPFSTFTYFVIAVVSLIVFIFWVGILGMGGPGGGAGDLTLVIFNFCHPVALLIGIIGISLQFTASHMLA